MVRSSSSERVVAVWNKLPQTVVHAPSRTQFEALVDTYLSAERREQNRPGKFGQKLRFCASIRDQSGPSSLGWEHFSTPFHSNPRACKITAPHCELKERCYTLFVLVIPGERKPLNDKQKPDPRSLGESLDYMYYSLNPNGLLISPAKVGESVNIQHKYNQYTHTTITNFPLCPFGGCAKTQSDWRPRQDGYRTQSRPATKILALHMCIQASELARCSLTHSRRSPGYIKPCTRSPA
ncbi:hypothetical protein T265_10245 [Opisthorchis viverrini]|uniref:Uncharacterized protein n=1 Tax=Opisthorchis viverrini TaxID=6198 RepID=A0A074Z771_OPIVI|nr:hypothetical protein T265_10245 [Opisthorchis viverrini]KER21427.1 hypothetical protein T265_10245 [Opisthorchis viverrini]